MLVVSSINDINVTYYDRWATDDLDTEEISIDTETTSLNPREGVIRLIQVYLPQLKQVAVLDLWDLDNYQKPWLHYLFEVLANNRTIKVLQNSMFDGDWFYQHYGVLLNNIHDTLIISQLLKAGQYDAFKVQGFTRPNSLEFLSQQCGYYVSKEQQKSNWGQDVLTQAQLDYAAIDPCVTYLVYEELKEACIKKNPQSFYAEMSALPAFIYMQAVGLPCDKETLDRTTEEYLAKSNELRQDLTALMPYDPVQHLKVVADQENPRIGKSGKPLKCQADKPFNPASPQQLVAYLQSLGFDEELIDRKTGNPSSAKDIVFRIRAENPDKAYAADLLKLAEFKSITTAASKLVSYQKSYDEQNRSLFTSFSPLATQGMGRSSSGRKGSLAQNTQNFSKFLPPHKKHGLAPIRSVCSVSSGRSLVEVDLDASHAKFAWWLSKDAALQRSEDEGIKLHYFTMASMLKMDGITATPEECILMCEGKLDKKRQDYYKHNYKLAKTVFYSFLNYAGAATLQSTFFKYEVMVSLEECKKYLEACAIAFSGLRRYQNDLFNKAKSRLKWYENEYIKGYFTYSKTLDGSMVWHYAPIRSNKFGKPSPYLKVSDVVSVQWMKPESVVMKATLGQVIQKQRSNEWDFRLVNFSHDSFMLDAADCDQDEVTQWAYNLSVAEMQKFIPVYAPGDPWQACIKEKNWEK